MTASFGVSFLFSTHLVIGTQSIKDKILTFKFYEGFLGRESKDKTGVTNANSFSLKPL